MGRTINSILAVCAMLALPAIATAQDDARAHFQRGQAAYETGDYDTAAQEWQRAYELDPRPALQYNLAQAYERLGRLDDAVRAYHGYIDNTQPDDPRAETARARLASLEQRLSQTSIHLTGGVEGATIFVDDEDRGRLPHPDPLRVEPGSHRIVVRADGYEDFVSVVAVSPGQSAEVPVGLRAGGVGVVMPSGGGGISTVGLIVASVGAAALIGGAVTGSLALSNAGDAPSSASPQADTARTLALMTDILLPVGAAAAIAGLILMFVLEPDLGGSAQVVPVVGPSYAGVGVLGDF